MTTTIKIPFITCSHTIRSAAQILCAWGPIPTTFTMTIPVGVYWTDPIYDGLASSSDAVDLLHLIAYFFDQQFGSGAATARPTYPDDSGDQSNFTVQWEVDSEVDREAYLSPVAPTNAEGLRILRRFGFDQVRVSQFKTDISTTADAAPTFYTPVSGIWCPGQGESQLQAEPETGRGVVAMSGSGVAYAYSLGSGRKERRIQFNAVPGNRVWDRGPVNVTSLQRQIWPYLSIGEQFRYYADFNALRTYLTADVAIDDDDCHVASVTGLAAGNWIWLNGEKVKIKSISSLTINIFRPDPVAHSKYDPVSNDVCGTFVLAPSGGDINMAAFPPAPRAYNQDRWNFAISAWRASP